MERQEDKEIVRRSWSIKKISIAVMVLVLAGTGLYFYFYRKQQDAPSVLSAIKNNVDFLGQTVDSKKDEVNKPNFKEDIDIVIKKVKEEIIKLTPDEVASSSNRIQEIINDLKTVQEKKDKPLDAICSLVCK